MTRKEKDILFEMYDECVKTSAEASTATAKIIAKGQADKIYQLIEKIGVVDSYKTHETYVVFKKRWG